MLGPSRKAVARNFFEHSVVNALRTFVLRLHQWQMSAFAIDSRLQIIYNTGMTLRPTPPKSPDTRPMTIRDWLPIVCIIAIVIYLVVTK